MKARRYKLVALAFLLLGLAAWFALPDNQSRNRAIASAGMATEPIRVDDATPAPLELRLDDPERNPVGAPSASVIAGAPTVEDERSKLVRMMSTAREWARVERWDKLYERFSIDDLKQEAAKLQTHVYDMSHGVLERRLASGQYELTGEIGETRRIPYNQFEVCWLAMKRGEPVKRVTLPEAGFGEVYKARALSLWLQEQVNKQSGSVWSGANPWLFEAPPH